MAFDSVTDHVDDMVNLPELSEGSILKNLQIRYQKELIYTYTGTILVAANPYKWISIYEDTYVKQYSQARFAELPPHIFAIAEATYYNLKSNGENQSVIISGESGAGKTESTKLILQYLTAVTSNQQWVEQQITEASTILESFGNAKTVRNNNSSRFGKFMQVLFSPVKQILGASIINYLLEKSRVVLQAPEERNYHCFYQLCLGATKEEKEKYRLLDPKDFHYLNQSGCITMETIKDAKEYEALKLAFTVMNMTPEEVESIFRVLAAILHLGNVNFKSNDDGESSHVTNAASVTTTAQLLEVDEKALTEAFVNRSLIVRGEQSKIPLKAEQSKDNRDAIAKSLYGRLFDWIVVFINNAIMPKEKTAHFIGVLDIFGFENFKVNSFEQLCINMANEKLQQFFTNYIFKLEQNEYDKESISWNKIEFTDNAECIELLEGKTGVFVVLDEECKVPKGNDQTYLAKMHEKFNKDKNYIRPKQATSTFGIKHYAGDVMYDITSFLDKNKDETSDLIVEVLKKSKNDLVKKLADVGQDDAADDKGKTMKKKSTVGNTFKLQLTSLVTTLAATNPQYVRCIKPNTTKSAFAWEDDMVLAQLRYSGMLETIRIRKAGYSMRVPFDIFLTKFKMLAPKIQGADSKELVTKILSTLKVNPDHWQIGKTKVFMRNNVYAPLEEAKEKHINKCAITVTKVIVGNYHRKRYLRMKENIVFLQKNMRMFIKRKIYRRKKASAIKIQSVVRGWFARDFYAMMKQEKAEAEERARKQAEEEERIRHEEELKRSKEAEEAEKRRLIEEAAEKARRIKEEEEILALTRQAQEVKVKMAAGSDTPKSGDLFGDMFSFLDVVDKDLASQRLRSRTPQDSLNAELDEMYSHEAEDYTKTVLRKGGKSDEPFIPGAPAPPPVYVPSTNIYENIKARKQDDAPHRAMKSNPLMKKAAEDEKKKKEEEETTAEHETMEAFAEKYFEEHEQVTGTLSMSLSRKKRPRLSTQEMLCFTKNPIPTSMMKINMPDDPRRDKMITVSVEIFREILKITDPAPKKEENIAPMIQNVVKLGIGVPELRDEIFVQLIRQTNENPKDNKHWEQIAIKGWQMLNICLASFPPSKVLAKYLRNYLRNNSVVNEAAEAARPVEDGSEMDAAKRIALKHQVAKIAKNCEEAFKQSVLNGARKLPPSALEIDAMKTGRPIICRFYFLDGNVKAIGVSSWTTAAQATKELAKRIDLPDTTGWSIYEVFPDREHTVKASDNIADILARWENDKRTSVSETKYQTLRKGQPSIQAVGGSDARFFLKRRLFRTPQKIPTDPIEYHLIYAQAVASVLNGDFPLTEQAALRLAALKAQVDWGDFDPSQSGRLQELHMYLPARFIPEKDKSDWAQQISNIHQKLAGKSTLQAKVLYLEAVKQFPMYGATFFAATYKGFWAYSENLMIAVHVDGIAWVHHKTKAIMKAYPYERLHSWELDHNVVILNFTPEPSDPDGDLIKCQFECFANEEVVSMIKDYSPNHRTGITKEEKEARRRQEMDISEAELGALGLELERCRQKLLDSNLLRVPGPDAAAANTSKFGTLQNIKKLTIRKSTLDRDTKKRSEKTASIALDYTLADWSFSKTRLSFSLSAFDLTLDADLNENSIRMHNCLLAYAGLVPAPTTTDEESARVPFALMIQDIMRGCIEVPKARDELYLQLIKMTTNHPEPDSKVVLKIWKLVAVACWIALPSQHILSYLKAHLRICAYGMAPTYARRKREREHAKYALRALQRTLSSGPRKQPPSADELIAVTNLKNMFARFHFMDGQSRALTFDPASTTSEILELVKEKINVKNCTGFALFESFGSLERAMTAKEKIADTVYKWDKFAKQTNSDKSLKLVFKRRIFMPPLTIFSNDTERDLVMYQAIHDIANDRFPVTEEEAAFLSALRAQIELGDTTTYTGDEQVYQDNVKKYMPKHFVRQGATQSVAAQHSKLRGKSKDECARLYMDHIMTWDLYGSTIFNVLQSYTSAMPNNLWLAVCHNGVHILNRRSKTPLLSYPYKSIVNYSPSHKNIMIMTESLTRGTKYVFNTSEASQIAHLIKDYTDAILSARKKEEGIKKSQSKENLLGPKKPAAAKAIAAKK